MTAARLRRTPASGLIGTLYSARPASIYALTSEYPRSCARLTATIPAGTIRAVRHQVRRQLGENGVGLHSVERAIVLAITRVALLQIANCTPCFASASRVMPRLGAASA